MNIAIIALACIIGWFTIKEVLCRRAYTPQEKKKTNKGCLSLLLIAALIFIGFITIDNVIPSEARRALPESATEVQEYYKDWFTGDFIRIIKARLPQDDFPLFVRNLGLEEKFGPRHGEEYNRISGAYRGYTEWWDEPEEMDHCYFDYTPGDDYFMRVKWKDGWVYFIASAW